MPSATPIWARQPALIREQVRGNCERWMSSAPICLDHAVKGIELRPHFQRNERPQRARILARPMDRRADRAGIGAVGQIERDDGVGPSVGACPGAIRQDGSKRSRKRASSVCSVSSQVQPWSLSLPAERRLHLDDARKTRRPLEIAREPEQRLGIARQEPHGSSASTQVSLVPPPCEELTMIEPSLSATRVSPPGSTQVSRPVIA